MDKTAAKSATLLLILALLYLGAATTLIAYATAHYGWLLWPARLVCIAAAWALMYFPMRTPKELG